jgi:hypothetical protein
VKLPLALPLPKMIPGVNNLVPFIGGAWAIVAKLNAKTADVASDFIFCFFPCLTDNERYIKIAY